MNDVSLELNEMRRREVALDTMRVARAANDGFRRSTALALVAAGQWLAREPSSEDRQPVPAPKMQVSGDCI